MHFDTSNGMESNTVNSLYMGSKGRLWVATIAGIATSMIRQSKLEIYNHKQGLIKKMSEIIIEDKKGKFGSVKTEELPNGKVMKRDF